MSVVQPVVVDEIFKETPQRLLPLPNAWSQTSRKTATTSRLLPHDQTPEESHECYVRAAGALQDLRGGEGGKSYVRAHSAAEAVLAYRDRHALQRLVKVLLFAQH